MFVIGRFFIFLFLFSGVFCNDRGSHDSSPVVDLGYARYKGTRLNNGISQWLGMRYAAPPLGNLRFQAPEDPPHVNGIQDALEHGLLCLATGADPNDNSTSEDCLFVDVYAPSNATTRSKLPVYVYIQGGGFQSNSNANLNGTGLIHAAEDQMIVVNFNYRVGLFGFLPGYITSREASLNNGLKDQRKLLEWIQRHITQFGGDPDHVVITGSSSGANSVLLHLTAYGGRDDHLFVGAASSSQAVFPMMTLDYAEYQYRNLVLRTGCANETNSLNCLRQHNASYLQAHDLITPYPEAQTAPLFMYGPVIDHDFVTDYTLKLFETGQVVKVPLLIGNDLNEGNTFVSKNTSSLAESNVFLQSQFPALTLPMIQQLNKLYPQDNSPPIAGVAAYHLQASNVYGEGAYVCPGIQISNAMARYTKVWNYRYAVEDPEMEALGNGVHHTVDVNSLWGPENVWLWKPPKSYYTTNAPIIPVMQGYWTSFARFLDPSIRRYNSSPEWSQWGKENNQQRLFIRTNATHMETVDLDQRERCSYWAGSATDLHQ